MLSVHHVLAPLKLVLHGIYFATTGAIFVICILLLLSGVQLILSTMGVPY